MGTELMNTDDFEEQNQNQNLNNTPSDLFLNPDNVDLVLKRADNFIKLYDAFRKKAIRITNVNDWVSLGGVPYLQLSGASKIAGLFGLKIFDQKYHPVDKGTDENGEYINYMFSGTVQLPWNKFEIPCIGTSSTRDKFFGYKDKNWLPVSEININNLKKKAFTNFLNKAIKSALGLNFTWVEIEEMSNGNIKEDKVKGHKFNDWNTNKPENKPDSKEFIDKKNKLREMILYICNDNKTMARQYLKSKTAYKNFKGHENTDNIKEKQLGFIFDEVLKEYNESQQGGHQ